jgi:SEC-C motif-containing protein
MRSRFAAFSLGLGEYLVRTLAHDHADLEIPRDVLVRELSRAHDRQRFLGLRVLHAEHHASNGRVMFYARVFEKGRDRSFVELSEFRREDGVWRYGSGIAVAVAELLKPIDELVPADLERSGE